MSSGQGFTVDLVVERLDNHHDLSSFSSGRPEVDLFLHRYARQNQRQNYGRTFVAVRSDDARVAGYFTLVATGLERANLPPQIKVSYDPLPAILLARFGVDKSLQGKGIGGWLLSQVFQHCGQLAETIGVFAVVVRALDEEVAGFYRRFGFEPLQDDPTHLYILMRTLRKR